MNKKTFTTKRKAFSLIELSIVLIIIGLLIAGVTGGASLIKNAELRSISSEARGYQTVVNAFYTRFNALPGDYGTSIGGSKYGNSNGKIEFGAGTTSPSCGSNCLESNVAWQQLKNGNFIADIAVSPDDTAVTTAGDAYNYALTPSDKIPASKSKGSGWIFDNGVGAGSVINTVILTGPISSPAVTIATSVTHPTFSASLTPGDALSIDTKSDDGTSNTGLIRGISSYTANCDYSTANTSKSCNLAFSVDVSS